MPSELAHLIVEPSFLNFISVILTLFYWLRMQKKFLPLQWKKGNSTISNLLNLGDGLLSDCLQDSGHLYVQCAINAYWSCLCFAKDVSSPITNSKPWKLLKQNRLIASTGRTKSYTHPVSLAEIFHSDEEDFSTQGGKTIGSDLLHKIIVSLFISTKTTNYHLIEICLISNQKSKIINHKSISASCHLYLQPNNFVKYAPKKFSIQHGIQIVYAMNAPHILPTLRATCLFRKSGFRWRSGWCLYRYQWKLSLKSLLHKRYIV